MANFQKYLPKLLAIEGGYVANDNGQPANRGILKATWDAYGIKGKSLRDITKADAEKVYKKYYWDHFSADYIANQALAEIVVDFGVNSGPRNAAKMVREAMGLPQGEGAWTASVLDLLNKSNAADLHGKIKAKREQHYQWLAKKDPKKYGDDLRGWLRRLDRFTIDKEDITPKKLLPYLTIAALVSAGIYVLNTQQNGRQTI